MDLKRLQADLEELLKRVRRALNKEGSNCFRPIMGHVSNDSIGGGDAAFEFSQRNVDINLFSDFSVFAFLHAAL